LGIKYIEQMNIYWRCAQFHGWLLPI